MVNKLTLKDLIARLDTPGWRFVSNEGDKPQSGTLKDVLQDTHQQKQSAGLIQQIETSVELDMIQIEQLWHYLGLPTV